MSKACVFCKSLREWKESDKLCGLSRKYKVALLLHSKKGRNVDYSVRGIGFSLNYCPECGRRIVRTMPMDAEK